MADRQTVQRRLAAILAADIAGYSRLMGADEVGTFGNRRGNSLLHQSSGDIHLK
jgi:class 3 adenylate cyclase